MQLRQSSSDPSSGIGRHFLVTHIHSTRLLTTFRLPDASVPVDIVRQDIASAASVGAGGVEFVPFYLYGLASGGPPPTDWTEFGFGSPAFKDILKAALKESKDKGLVMDIGQGANQGQGVPATPLSPGLAVELVRHSSNTTF